MALQDLLVGTAAPLADRLRPWRAPAAPPGAPLAVVIGAGPAGLASAVMLRTRGLRAVVHDRRPWIGGSWPERYDSLRLNTVRWMSDLPGCRLLGAQGRWVGRDGVVSYLRRYAAWHDLETRLEVSVDSIDPEGDDWLVTVDGQATRCAAVVVAAGASAVGVVPPWPGADRFRGPLLHSSEYRRPGPLAGRRVLVVGAGSSGGEIAIDLHRAGSAVTWSVRTAPAVFPRQVGPVPTTPFGAVADLLGRRVTDRAAPVAERAVYGVRDYLPPPPARLSRLLERCKEPLTADGIVALLRRGEVRVVGAVDRLTEHGVVLADGSPVTADAIIAATGYRPDLSGLVGHLGVLDADGRPNALVPRPGLGFVGYRVPLAGTLWAVELDARRVARRLRPPSPRSPGGGSRGLTTRRTGNPVGTDATRRIDR